MSDVLIVGCGYLGRAAARIMLERGLEVAGTTRSEAKARELRALGVEPVICDVVAAGPWAPMPEARLVLHCVGYDRKSSASQRQVYVEGLERMLRDLPGTVERLVFASSTGVYGQGEGGWVDESSPAEPRTASGQVVREAELVLERWSGGDSHRAVTIRYSGLYGPGRLIRQATLERGEPIPADPDHWLNLIHIDDAALAAVAALLAPEPGRLYLASDDRPLPRREFYNELARLLGAPEPRFVRPAEPGRDASNKRVDSRRIKRELDLRLSFPDVLSGLPAAVSGR